MGDKGRILKNTFFLYIRLVVVLLVGIYTTKIILSALGFDDFGIYNVVGGLVTTFTILTSSLSNACSRFITYEMGKQSGNRLNLMFSTSLMIMAILSLILVVFVETIGLWYLNTYMNITPDRLYAANWCLQFSLFTLIAQLFAVPYNASIIAHEKMGIFAYISIVDVLLKLIIVYLLQVSTFDKLIFYSFLLFLVSLLMLGIYMLYCTRNFYETHFRLIYDRAVIKDMFGYASWNFLGDSSVLARTQGIDLVMNYFYGSVINASRGISVKISTMATGFVSNFLLAIRPQILQNLAQKKYDELYDLIFYGTRFSYYLVLIISIPIILEAPLVLKLWLNEYPPYTVEFVRLTFVGTLLESLTGTVVIAIVGCRDIKKYMIAIFFVSICTALPFCLLFSSLGLSPVFAFISSLFPVLFGIGIKVIYAKKMFNFPIGYFLRKVVMRLLVVTFLSLLLPLLLYVTLFHNSYRLVAVLFLGMPYVAFIIYLLGLTGNEKKQLYHRFFHKRKI